MTEARASTEGMKGGGYYDAHSEYQRRVIEGGDVLIRKVVSSADLGSVEGAYAIADYGAGTGATSVHAVRTAIEAVRTRAPTLPVLTIHNDVPTNDFTQLFRNVSGEHGYLGLEGGAVYATAAAGSFFDQVVPDGTVDLGMCSNAAHWFRRQPEIRVPEGIFFSAAAGDARTRLAAEAAADWDAFLAARTAELAAGGRMLVQGIGTELGEDGGERISAARLLEAMGAVATELADEGLLDRETLERYVFPVYCRSAEEAAAPVRAGGRLAGELEVASVDVDEVPNPYWEALESGGDVDAYADAYVQFVRAFSESTMMANLFEPGARGVEPAALCDRYFDRLRAATAADPEAGRYEAWVVRIVFGRR